MSTIDRSYCLVCISIPDGRFRSILAVRPTYEEIIEVANETHCNEDEGIVIWSVVN